MKTTKTLLTLIAGSLVSAAVHAQVEVTITGSTAFRSVVYDRAYSLFDTAPTGASAVTNSALITWSGTMTTLIPSLGSTPVKLRFSFSGSGSGMLAVKNATPVSTAESPGVNVNKVPDIALSDVFPGAATPAIPDAAFDRDVLGIVPFVIFRNNALTGLNNLGRSQAQLLAVSSGILGGQNQMPATYLGGSSTNPVYFVGRDSGSGTRISVHADIGYPNPGAPTLWATNGAGTWVLTNGYSSGATVAKTVGGMPDAIGYAGLPDFNTVSNLCTAMSYQGVPFSPTNVINGIYEIWGYEHIVNRAGGLSSNQQLVRDALIGAITNPDYQRTNILYYPNFVTLQDMKVERGSDGGAITSKSF